MVDSYIVFVHGYNSSSKMNWFPKISEELKKLNIDHSIPDLPGGEYPDIEGWMEEIHRAVSEANKPLVFIGHSLGTRAVLLYIEKYKPQVQKVILFSPPANRIENAKRRDGKYAKFYDYKINTSEIRPIINSITVVYSKNDELVDYNQCEELANELGAKTIVFENMNHFLEESDWETVFNVLKEELLY